MVSVVLYPYMVCVALSMDLFVLCIACLTVFVNCLVKQFAIWLGMVVILFWTLWCCLMWLEVLYWMTVYGLTKSLCVLCL